MLQRRYGCVKNSFTNGCPTRPRPAASGAGKNDSRKGAKIARLRVIVIQLTVNCPLCDRCAFARVMSSGSARGRVTTVDDDADRLLVAEQLAFIRDTVHGDAVAP